MDIETTPVELDEHGDEVHPSFVMVSASRISAAPGVHLFDSEIQHREFVRVRVAKAKRKRDLHHDWLFGGKDLIEIDMSLSQWGAFVSSFGQGSGVPATLAYFNGERVPEAPSGARLALSVAEVKNAGAAALEDIGAAFDKVEEAFDAKAGRKEMSSLIHHLRCMIDNGPGNMAFTAKSLTEHVEKVVTKAKADIEGMVNRHAATLGLEAGDLPQFALGSGDDES